MNFDTDSIVLTGLIALAALLYSAVGHGGSSGYLAAMSLFGLAPAVMMPTALVLNIAVASTALYKFYRSKAFSWRLFWPIALLSVPCAYLGGTITLPGHWYKPLVGVVLVYAAGRSFYGAKKYPAYEVQLATYPILMSVGAVLGLLSGLTGVGGGIFLSPLMLFFRWAQIRVISGIAAAFILVNSTAGLLGVLSKTSLDVLPKALPLWLLVAVLGGFIGAEYGSRRLANPTLQKLLAAVLLIAGVKMIVS
jgi:uncharacterized membrane protein YfcA